MHNHGPAIIVFALLLFPGSAATAPYDEAPDTLTLDRLQELYEPVEFDHAMHMAGYDCSLCHHHTTGDGCEHPVCSRCHASTGPADQVACSGCHPDRSTSRPASDTPLYHIDKPDLLGALHLQCLSCHRADGGPTGCRECHALTEAGSKRFFLQP